MALPQPSAKDDWTVETLRQHVVGLLAERDRTAAEVDRRVQQQITDLRALLDERSVAQRTAMDAALAAAKEAVLTAKEATDNRLAAMNEFRNAVNDILSRAMPRIEAEARISAITEKLTDADRRVEQASVALNEKLSALDKRVAENSSRVGGHTDSTRNLVTIIGLVLTAVTVIVGVYLAFHK